MAPTTQLALSHMGSDICDMIDSFRNPVVLFDVQSPDDLQLLSHFQFPEHIHLPDHNAKAVGVI
jgi:hypothetical protein